MSALVAGAVRGGKRPVAPKRQERSTIGRRSRRSAGWLPKSLACFVAAAASGAVLPRGALADDFYAGKTITISTHGGVGGEYDGYLRLLQRFLGKYIPGNPNIVVINQVGAGGLLAINYAAKIAPQDGTHLVMAANGLLLFQAVGMPGLQVSLGDFKWIGNFSASNSITVVWHTAGVRTIEEARQKEVIIGSSGAGSISALLPAAHNALAGTKFKVLLGYEGAAKMNIAIRQGELQGRSGSTWSAYLTDFPEIKEGLLIPLSQAGTVRDPRLPDVPLLTEIVGNDPNKQAAAELVSLSLTQNRSVAAPPGVPDDRVELLRTAFDKVMHDRQFLAEAQLSGLDIEPTTGAAVQQTVREVLSMPKDVIETTRAALNINAK
jgi:tripartite-type tricarboxylate transporter receptor subunit TctC